MSTLALFGAATEPSSVSTLIQISTEILNVYNEHKRETPRYLIEFNKKLRDLQSALEVLDRHMASDLPPEAKQTVVDIQADLETFKQWITNWSKRDENRKGFVRFVPAVKPFLVTIGPACALYFAMAPSTMVIALFVAAIAFVYLRFNQELYRELLDAWENTEMDKCRAMVEMLDKHSKQLRQIHELHKQIKNAQRYDVTKTLQDKPAREFWIKHFGAEKHSVATGFFIETLLFFSSQKEYEFKDQDRKIVYDTIQHIVDINKDGDVSPHEFKMFLQFFGPLPQCIDKVVSLIDLTAEPPTVRPWFSWKAMDRKDTTSLPATPGTFVIRCSSQPGSFALDWIDDHADIKHSKIFNEEQGYRFEGTSTHFKSLDELVAQYDNLLCRAFVDPSQIVHLNVSGHLFETKIGHFLNYPNTLLGHRFASKRIEDKPLFIDRDYQAFAVILNWYRYGRLMIPPNVPRALVAEEILHFRLPIPVEAVFEDAVGVSSDLGAFSRYPNGELRYRGISSSAPLPKSRSVMHSHYGASHLFPYALRNPSFSHEPGPLRRRDGVVFDDDDEEKVTTMSGPPSRPASRAVSRSTSRRGSHDVHDRKRVEEEPDHHDLALDDTPAHAPYPHAAQSISSSGSNAAARLHSHSHPIRAHSPSFLSQPQNSLNPSRISPPSSPTRARSPAKPGIFVFPASSSTPTVRSPPRSPRSKSLSLDELEREDEDKVASITVSLTPVPSTEASASASVNGKNHGSPSKSPLSTGSTGFSGSRGTSRSASPSVDRREQFRSTRRPSNAPAVDGPEEDDDDEIKIHTVNTPVNHVDQRNRAHNTIEEKRHSTHSNGTGAQSTVASNTVALSTSTIVLSTSAVAESNNAESNNAQSNNAQSNNAQSNGASSVLRQRRNRNQQRNSSASSSNVSDSASASALVPTVASSVPSTASSDPAGLVAPQSPTSPTTPSSSVRRHQLRLTEIDVANNTLDDIQRRVVRIMTAVNQRPPVPLSPTTRVPPPPVPLRGPPDMIDKIDIISDDDEPDAGSSAFSTSASSSSSSASPSLSTPPARPEPVLIPRGSIGVNSSSSPHVAPMSVTSPARATRHAHSQFGYGSPFSDVDNFTPFAPGIATPIDSVSPFTREVGEALARARRLEEEQPPRPPPNFVLHATPRPSLSGRSGALAVAERRHIEDPVDSGFSDDDNDNGPSSPPPQPNSVSRAPSTSSMPKEDTVDTMSDDD